MPLGVTNTLQHEKQIKNTLSSIVQKELSGTFKQAQTAFAMLDFRGHGFVTVQDFCNSKIMYRLPFTKDEFQKYLETCTVFKRNS